MPAILLRLFGYVISGVIARLLLSVGVGLFSAVYISKFVKEYLGKAQSSINTALSLLPPEALNLIGLARVDDAISVLFGGLTMLATIKSLKFVVSKTS